MEYNGVVLLNKPMGPTSHDMIYELRRIFSTKRVGHTGTLDPMATGVLPVCIGNATKASDMLLCEKKEYIAGIKFGISTDTGDITGNVVSENGFMPDSEALISVLEEFKGKQMQVPPMYSAKKVNGKKLYDLAREGKTVEREPVPIEIYDIELVGEDRLQNSYSVRVLCSKGTYVRVLCEDIGKKLGTPACMSSLVRTASGDFRIESTYTVNELKEAAEKGTLSETLIPTAKLFSYPEITLSEKQSERMKNGVFVSHPGISDGMVYRVFDSDGVFFAIAECINGRLKIIKSFRS
ncbi:MAG: tRNA pseudouridine(55) synthase TruB [Clostridia bacterium]|nr:tRNA pseudouridine(55) synthase TruB [Clostridia bacterium]